MEINEKNIGIAFTGSFCTYKKSFAELENLVAAGARVQTIFSNFSLRRCAFAAISTGLSVIPFASFATVFPVQGIITIRSNIAEGPTTSDSLMVRNGFFPVISSARLIKLSASPNRLSIFCDGQPGADGGESASAQRETACAMYCEQ